MTVWLELALYALDEPADQLAAALDSLASFGGAKGVRIEVFSQEIDIGVPDGCCWTILPSVPSSWSKAKTVSASES